MKPNPRLESLVLEHCKNLGLPVIDEAEIRTQHVFAMQYLATVVESSGIMEAVLAVIDCTVDAATYPDGPCIPKAERSALADAYVTLAKWTAPAQSALAHEPEGGT